LNQRDDVRASVVKELDLGDARAHKARASVMSRWYDQAAECVEK